MARGRYELRAEFTASNKSGRAIGSLLAQLEKLEKKIEKLEKKDANVRITETGADRVEDRIDDLERKTAKATAKPKKFKVGYDEKEAAKFERHIENLEKELQVLVRRPYLVDLRGDPDHAERTIRQVNTKLKRLTEAFHTAEIKAELKGDLDVAARLARLRQAAADASRQRASIVAELRGAPSAMAGLIILKRQAMDTAGTYHINIDYRGMAGARIAAMGLVAGMQTLMSTLRAATPLPEYFARRVYVAQQAMQVFGAAIMVTAVAAAGPLVSGLTIAIFSLTTFAGGLGLVAAAFAPVISMLQKDAENAEKAATAQNQLETATRGVASAKDSYKSAVQSAEQANEAYEQATDDLNYALQTEKYRLQDLRYELQGLQIDQKEVILDIKEARKELAEAESPEERQRAQLQLERLLLRQKQLQNDVRDSQNALNRARRRGTDELQSAKSAAQTAKRAQVDAANAVKQAMQGVVDAQKEQAKAQREVNALTKGLPKYAAAVKNSFTGLKRAFMQAFKPARIEAAGLAVQLMNMSQRSMPALGATALMSVRGLGQAVNTILNEFQRFGVIRSLHRILASMPDITRTWSVAFGRFAGGFLNVMGIAVPFARQFSRYIANAALSFLKWTNSEKGREKIRQFFRAAAPVAAALWHWIVKIGGAILSWSVRHPQRVAAMINFLGRAVWRTGVFIVGVINAIGRFRQEHPVLAKTIWFFLKWGVLVWAARGAILKLHSGVKFLTAAVAWFGRLGLIAVRGIGPALAATRLLAFGVGTIFIWAASAAYYAFTGFFGFFLPGMRRLGAVTDNSVEFAVAAFRGWGAWMVTTWLKVILLPFRILFSVLALIPGKTGDAFSNANKKATENLEKLRKGIAGKTFNAAVQMDKNMNKGADAGIGATKRVKNTGGRNIEAFNIGAVKNIENTRKKTGSDFEDMMKKAMGTTGTMKMKGLKNFGDFKVGGIKQSDLLRGGSSKHMLNMQRNVNKSTETTKKKGIEALVELQNKGATAMAMAQQRWVDSAWKAAIGIVAAMNAILKGIAKFIEETGIDSKKPGTIQMSTTGMPRETVGGVNRGTTRQPGGRNARGNIHRFAAGGTMAPTGGVAQGTTRVFGEVPGTTEFYITDNPRYWKRNMEILASANAHMMSRAMAGTTQYAHGGKYLGSGIAGRLGRAALSDKQGALRVVIEDMLPGVFKKFAWVFADDGTPVPVHEKTGRQGTTKPNTLERKYLGKYWSAQRGGGGGGGSLPPKGKFRNTGGDHTVNYSATRAASGRTSRGARQWRGLARSGGRDVHVAMANLRGRYRGLSYSSGKILLDPASTHVAAAHELGHQFGLGHGGYSIMGGAGRVTSNDFAALRKYYGTGTPGSGGHSRSIIGSGSPGSIRRRRRVYAGSSGAQTSHTSAGPSGAGTSNLWVPRRMAVGGVLETEGQLTSTRQNLKAAEYWMQQGKHGHMAKGGILVPQQRTPMRSGEYRNYSGTTYNWEPWVRKIKDDVVRYVGGITANTYPNHGGRGSWGERHSVDYWGPGGRGAAIGSAKGEAVESRNLSKHKKNMMYYIWQGMIHGWGGSKRYSDGSDMHYDHFHGTYRRGANLGGAAGGIDYNKVWEKHVPTVPDQFGFGIVGDVSRRKLENMRRAAKQKYVGMAGSWSGGGSLNEWIKKGLTFGNAFPATPTNIQKVRSRAMQESGGNPNAVNNWDSNAAAGTPSKGLLQIIKPTWEMYRRRYGADAGGFDQNWNNPIKSVGVGTRYMKGRYGYIVAANGAGYGHGGLAQKAHMGVVGDRGKEAMVPLDDPRAVRAISSAFDKSRRTRATGGGGTTEHMIRREVGNYIAEVKDEIADLKRTIRAELRENLKEIALDVETQERLVEFGVKTALAAMKSQYGGDIIDEQSAKKMDFDFKLQGKRID